MTRWPGTPEDRFWQKVIKTPTCWLWTGYVNEDGYGIVRLEGKSHGAHRIAWRMSHGEIPQGVEVCHRCDVPACVNVEHLFIATHQENIADALSKGRMVWQAAPHKISHPGESNSMAKLREKEVKEIRRLYQTKKFRHKDLARKFGVSQALVCMILNRQIWKEVA